MEDHIPDYLLDQYQQAFNLFDNKSGYIDSKDLSSALKSLTPSLTDKEIINLTKDLKKVDFNLFSQLAHKSHKQSDIEDDVINAFRVFDKNETGLITLNELKHIMTTTGDKLTEQEVNLMIREADVDSNNNINYEEFVRSMMAR